MKATELSNKLNLPATDIKNFTATIHCVPKTSTFLFFSYGASVTAENSIPFLEDVDTCFESFSSVGAARLSCRDTFLC